MLTNRYEAYGHDLSKPDIERAKRSGTRAVFTVGAADNIPYSDNFFDGVLLLDVLEHVPDERAVLTEVARVLRPGGELIVSVPNQGLLAGFDSLNLYRIVAGKNAPPPTDDPSWLESPNHRHYSLDGLVELLSVKFRIRSADYTGIGFAEVINLVLLLFFRSFLKAPRVYDVVRYLYFGAYLAEDLLHTGRWGYHLMVEAERV